MNKEITIDELIAKLQAIKELAPNNGNMEVVGLADEFATYHPLIEPKVYSLVKGNVLFSDNEHWVLDEGDHLIGLSDKPIKIKKRMSAVRIF